MPTLLNTLQKRQLVYQFTGQSLAQLLEEVKVAYIGLDATAPSIHAGYLIPITLGRILAEYGVEIIVLLGGATTRVGDPSGKNKARKMLDDDEFDVNFRGLMKAIKRFFPYAKHIVNNNDWLSQISLMEYLTQIAPHVSINRLIHADFFGTRLNNQDPLSMLELNYPILQGYDFWHLNREFGCNLQFSGSDQWSNVLMGVDLIAKKEKKVAYGLTCPLLLTHDGKKMGKSEQGAIWLDEELFSVQDFWQYWRNIDDKDCGKYMEILIGDELDASADINIAKKYLATQLTALVHGQEAASKAQSQAEMIFEAKNWANMKPVQVEAGVLYKIVAKIFGESNSASKILIEQGAIMLNDSVERDCNTMLNQGQIAVICKSKKHFVRIECI